ncbi:fructose PTS transporter subunit IIA [Escherichia coli]|uniref:fructose PTS transporter subunit IIA n=1 Tax=Escherichia coli TaxID=562 RepID=UPI003D6BCE47
MLTIQFLCPLPNGLHARPAWELKEQCSQWQSEITFINHRQNAKADAKSSLALIGTGTLFNDSCSLNISGSDEEQARRVLEEYIQVRFIDSDSVQPTQAELTAHPLPRSLSRLNPDLLYGNVLASGVGVGTLTLLQSDSLDSYRAIPASAQDSTRLEHSLATLAEQLNQQLRERDGESKTILSAHLSLIQDDEFAGNIRRLMTEQHQGLAAGDKPIIFRTMDIGGDKSIPYLNIPQEENPFLGYRAVRIYPEFAGLFRTQLRAILRAASFGNAQLMIPMVHSLDQILWVKGEIQKAIVELKRDGLRHAETITLGIMVEVPSVCYIIDHFCDEVDFFSIGSNDMTQYLYAVDRNNPRVSPLYNPITPSFLRMLQQIVTTAHQRGKWVGICGELGGESRYLPLLLGLGLDELSMSSPRIPAVKSQLRQLDSEACRELARQACECRSAQEIEALLTAFTPEEDVRPLLALENIFVDQEFSNKEQAIQFLCGNLGVNGRTEHPFELEEDVWQREEIVTTGVGFGVAIPHTKSQWIRHSSISIARLAKPIDWQSEMGEVELVIMLTLGANEGMNHVKVFSQLARKLVNKNFRQSLFAAQDAQSILTLLETELTF